MRVDFHSDWSIATGARAGAAGLKQKKGEKDLVRNGARGRKLIMQSSCDMNEQLGRVLLHVAVFRYDGS